MSDVDHTSDDDIETAIAAAAYAIAYMEEEGSPNQEKPTEEFERTPTKTRSKREDSMNKQMDTINITKPIDTSSVTKPTDASNMTRPTDTSKISRWPSGKEAKGDGRLTGEVLPHVPLLFRNHQRGANNFVVCNTIDINQLRLDIILKVNLSAVFIW